MKGTLPIKSALGLVAAISLAASAAAQSPSDFDGWRRSDAPARSRLMLASQSQSPGAYAVPLYSGPRILPNFSGRQRAYRELRTVIRNGFRSQELFAGHYVMIPAGCGTDCVFYHIGDLKTGDVFDFPLGGENNMDLNLKYKPTSRLMRAFWNDSSEGPCMTELIAWDGRRFEQFAAHSTPGRCPS